MPQISYAQATWPAAGTTSNAVKLAGVSLFGLILPSGFTGTSITFTASDAIDGTYATVKNTDGTAYTLTVSGAGHHVIAPATLAGIEFLKIVSGSSEAASRVVKLVVREAA